MKPFLHNHDVKTEEAGWVSVLASAHKKRRDNYRYLYIGYSALIPAVLNLQFHQGTVVKSYEEAKVLLLNGSRLAVQPDVIFIDLPYTDEAFESFCELVKQEEALRGIPVFYHSAGLERPYIGHLKKCSDIDDIVDLTDTNIDFISKVAFVARFRAKTLNAKKFYHQNTFSHYSDLVWKYTLSNLRRSRKVLAPKRILDIVLASLALIILLPLFLIIAIGIKLTSKGPVFYTQPRAGRGFRIFDFYKFRTMHVNADRNLEALAHLNQYNLTEAGPVFFKVKNDPRITPFGLFLRNTSLDELPQLINVIKGDMSLVGNRPLPLYEAATLTTNEFVERFMAPAGMTGLWQVKKRGKTDMSSEERIKLDIQYARRANLVYDLGIMARTPGALLQKTNV